MIEEGKPNFEISYDDRKLLGWLLLDISSLPILGLIAYITTIFEGNAISSTFFNMFYFLLIMLVPLTLLLAFISYRQEEMQYIVKYPLYFIGSCIVIVTLGFLSLGLPG